jgi:hypothetical protein
MNKGHDNFAVARDRLLQPGFTANIANPALWNNHSPVEVTLSSPLTMGPRLRRRLLPVRRREFLRNKCLE